MEGHGFDPMLISVFGTPSPLTYWTLDAVKLIVEELYGTYGFLQVSRLAELQSSCKSLDERLRDTILVFSENPESSLASSVAKCSVATRCRFSSANLFEPN